MYYSEFQVCLKSPACATAGIQGVAEVPSRLLFASTAYRVFPYDQAYRTGTLPPREYAFLPILFTKNEYLVVPLSVEIYLPPLLVCLRFNLAGGYDPTT